MEYNSILSNDNCKLAFQTSLPLETESTGSDPRYKTLILLIHGFSGSSSYFQKNVPTLSKTAWVVAPDLRGHGSSGRPSGGYHVARLAADLRELVHHLRSVAGQLLQQGEKLTVIPVGCSIGAAVLWTYVELFTDADFAGMIFVDQAPLQDQSRFDDWDAGKAHRGCYDEASMLAAQETWISDPEGAFKGLVADCLGYRFAPLPNDDLSDERRAADEAFFTGESRKCNTTWLARLLADHTRYDHREACEMIRVPVLVMAGKRTGCFPLDGMKETVSRVEKGFADRDMPWGEGVVRWLEFESGHWLFWEEPEVFDAKVIDFIEECC